jgi:hypothetical protein
MPEYQTRRKAAFHAQLTVMKRAVVGTTDGDKTIRLVSAAVGAQIEMMQIKEIRIPTSRDNAASGVPTNNESANCRRNVLRGSRNFQVPGPRLGVFCARPYVGNPSTSAIRVAPMRIACRSFFGGTHLGSASKSPIRSLSRHLVVRRRHHWPAGEPDVLRVTVRHLHYCIIHFDHRASARLPTAATMVANSHRNLVARSPLIRRPAQHASRHSQNRRHRLDHLHPVATSPSLREMLHRPPPISPTARHAAARAHRGNRAAGARAYVR